MYKILIISLLTTLLLASNPKIYSALGDVIYGNVDKIEKLKDIEVYSLYKSDIIKYVSEVNETKKKGFALEISPSKDAQKAYLESLRELSKKNDFFVRSAQSNYKKAMKDENNLLFSKLINSGIIDTQKNKQEIINYYFKHSDDINASGIIETYINEDALLKKKQSKQKAKYKTKKMREAEKIKRIRQNDIDAQKELEKKLQDEVNKKKLEIRKNQKIELTK